MNRFVITSGAFAIALTLPSVALAQKPAPQPSPLPGVEMRQQAGVPPQITLSQAIDIAVAKSPVLASARADYELARVPVDLARTAVFPNVAATASISRSNNGGRASAGSTGSTNGAAFGGGSFTSKGLNVNLRQLIYDGGKVLAQLHSAQAGEVGGLQTYQRQTQTLAFDVAQAYYTALQAHQATVIAAQIVNQNLVQENLVRAQITAGTAARADLSTAQLPTAQARVALVRAQGQELTAIAAFANTLGLDADTLVVPVDDTTGASERPLLVAPLTYTTAITRALGLRPDYLAAQNGVNAAQFNVKAARLGSFPTLSGTASAGTNSTLPNGTGFASSNSVGVALNVPVFDQGITHAQTMQAQAQLDKANAQLDNAKLGVEVNVRQAIVNLITAQSALQQSDAELAKARQVLDSTQAQYRAGVTTLPLLLNAQVGLTQALTDRNTALYTVRQAQQAYRFALGESDLSGMTP